MSQQTQTFGTVTLHSVLPTTVHTHHATHLSGNAIALAALAAVVVLLCLVWALARMLAYEPHWSLSLRHSLAEAGYRASATWAEFSDWARLGH